MTTAVGIVTHQNDIIHLIITITTEIVTIVIPIEKVIRQEKGCIRHLAMAKTTGTEIITDQIAGKRRQLRILKKYNFDDRKAVEYLY